MSFPQTRLRRLRANSLIREMVSETSISVSDVILPLFVCPGKNIKKPISSMPGVFQMSVDVLLTECAEVIELGIPAILLFGIPETKDEHGHVACEEHGIVQQAVKAIKKRFNNSLLVIVDVCNCEYTTHGHCGTIVNGDVDNDSTLITLGKQAVSLAQAGADIIAPSDMMDGRIMHIRKELDNNNFSNIPIISYSAKYSSAFYGPFREAAESAPQFGNRKTYQMNPANSNEAMREIELDIEEGTDMIMIKPALSYLDIIYRAKQTFNIPIVAYNVSGEYSMIKAAGEKNWIAEEAIIMEMAISMKRAGADLIITYFAKDIAKILQQK